MFLLDCTRSIRSISGRELQTFRGFPTRSRVFSIVFAEQALRSREVFKNLFWMLFDLFKMFVAFILTNLQLVRSRIRTHIYIKTRTNNHQKIPRTSSKYKYSSFLLHKSRTNKTAIAFNSIIFVGVSRVDQTTKCCQLWHLRSRENAMFTISRALIGWFRNNVCFLIG